jgi:hypothetical protein
MQSQEDAGLGDESGLAHFLLIPARISLSRFLASAEPPTSNPNQTMKSPSSSIIPAVVGSMLCLAQSALAAPPQQVPESGTTSLGLLALALGSLGFLKFFLKYLAKK